MARPMELADNTPCRAVLKNVKENMFTMKTGISKIIKNDKKETTGNSRLKNEISKIEQKG